MIYLVNIKKGIYFKILTLETIRTFRELCIETKLKAA